VIPFSNFKITITAVGMIACLGLGSVVHAADRYIIRDLGELPPGSTVEGLNSLGQVVGMSPADSRNFTAWWHNGKRMIDLEDCGGVGCRAMAINAKSQIVGDIGRDAFIYAYGKFMDISAFVRPPGIALDLNDSSEIVGWYTLIPVPGADFASERHAFYYRGRMLVDLGTLGGKESVATGINNAGQIIGYASTYEDKTHGFLVHQEKMVDLGTLGGTESFATGINDKGQVVGKANVAGTNKPHAFLYSEGAMKDLGTLGEPESAALGINREGQVVGTSGSRGFLYSQGKMMELTSLIPGGASLKNLIPCCINDRRQIAGLGVFADGKPHAFLMTPTP